jgi:hypothetical protein
MMGWSSAGVGEEGLDKPPRAWGRIGMDVLLMINDAVIMVNRPLH